MFEEVKERSREQSLEKDKKAKATNGKEDTRFFSYENYKKKSILDYNFKEINPPFENYELSLFQKKAKAIELFNQMKEKKDTRISIEDILFYDNTEKVIQLEYLKIAVNKLIKEEEPEKISILIEKINKSGVICDEIDYNKSEMDHQITQKFKDAEKRQRIKMLNKIEEGNDIIRNLLYKIIIYVKSENLI